MRTKHGGTPISTVTNVFCHLGDDELLEADRTHHVIFPRGELPWTREITQELHGRISRGELKIYHMPPHWTLMILSQGRN